MSMCNTDEAIYSAFFCLSKKNKISDITITALCKQAGIARTTFYAHYNNISDIVCSLQKSYLSGMEKIMVQYSSEYYDTGSIVDFILNNYETPKLFLVEQPDPIFIEKYKSAAQKYIQHNRKASPVSDIKIFLVAEMCKYYLSHMDLFDKSVMDEHIKLIDAIINQK